MKVKWEGIAPLPVGRSAHTAVLLHGSVYVGGGYEGQRKDCYRLDVYNLTTGRWDLLPITTPHCLFAMTVLDDKLVIAGGWTKSNRDTSKVLLLDHGKWKDFDELPTARASANAFVFNSAMIVVGGQALVSGTYIGLATTEILDTTNGCWYKCDNLPMPLMQLKGKIINNTLYLLGGFDKSGTPSLQVFTATLDNLSSHQLKWQSLPDTPWCCSTPVVLYNKYLLTVGGRQSSASSTGSNTSEVCAFDPSTGLWRQITTIPAARTLPAIVNVADDTLIMMGGANMPGDYSCDTYIGQCI